jgi:hypothetical protein
MLGLTIVKKKDLEGLIIENETLKEEKARAVKDAVFFRKSWEHCRSLVNSLESKLARYVTRPRDEYGRFIKVVKS